MKKVMKNYRMTKFVVKTNDNAVVGIVTAILIIGLIVAVISIIQTIYVPKIMEQREAEHMDEVAQQFASLTSVIGDQAADERRGVPIATFVTLGSKELPYLVSSKAFGTLEILENSSALTFTDNDTINDAFSIGTISYSSANAYFLDQSYTYETGAMIVSQLQGNLMMIPPSLLVDYNETNNTVNITFDVVNISSIGQKTLAAGFGSYPIQTEFREISINKNYTDVRSITIATSFSNAWSNFFNHSLITAGLNAAGYVTQFLLTETVDGLKLDFLKSDIYPDFYPTVNINFRIIEIRAQIGPGWIE